MTTATRRNTNHEAPGAIKVLKVQMTKALKAAGFTRDQFAYSNDSREYAHYPTADERTLDSMGITYRPGIYLYSREPNAHTSGAAHRRAQIRLYEMAAALVQAGFQIEVQQNHSGHTGQILAWADENGAVI